MACPVCTSAIIATFFSSIALLFTDKKYRLLWLTLVLTNLCIWVLYFDRLRSVTGALILAEFISILTILVLTLRVIYLTLILKRPLPGYQRMNALIEWFDYNLLKDPIAWLIKGYITAIIILQLFGRLLTNSWDYVLPLSILCIWITLVISCKKLGIISLLRSMTYNVIYKLQK